MYDHDPGHLWTNTKVYGRGEGQGSGMDARYLTLGAQGGGTKTK